MITNVFQRPETVPIWAEVKDWEGNYITPSHGVTLIHLAYLNKVSLQWINKVENQPMTLVVTGKYVYYYSSEAADEPGWWKYRTKSQDGSGDGAKYTVTDGGFKLT